MFVGMGLEEMWNPSGHSIKALSCFMMQSMQILIYTTEFREQLYRSEDSPTLVSHTYTATYGTSINKGNSIATDGDFRKDDSATGFQVHVSSQAEWFFSVGFYKRRGLCLC
jgi:hypothetical protein